ncbi:phage tail tape measure protein [Escherichia coli]|nr:phage tail tape measure protein [Escherichia coli]
MSTKFYTLLTDIGAAKLASAAALGVPLKITHMAVGDGGGVLPTPDAKQTALVNEKRRAALNMLYIDPQNSSQIIAEQVIPENEGGWWIREVGLFDESGALIAVGNCPESYKPQLAEGSGRTQTVRMVLITSSTDNITLKIDPAVVLATRKYVDDKALELKVYADDQMAKHLAAPDPHSQYAPKASPTFTGTPKAPTPAAGNNTTQVATTAFVQAALTALINGAPATLDTLKEIAAAINNDPNFSTTINNALALKAPLSSPALTGTPTAPTAAQSVNNTQIATTAFVKSAIAGMVGSAPAALDTLNELAAALGNDALNYLDDNAMSKGADIIDVMQRLGGVADRLDYRKAAALGSTFLTLGAAPEVAASAANAMVRELSIATMQSKSFFEGMNLLKLNPEVIEKQMTKDAMGTIQRVLEKVNPLPQDKRLSAMTMLFGKEFGDDAAKLANNLPELQRQLKLTAGNDALGSMQKESDINKDSLSAQWLLVKTGAQNTFSSLGETLRQPLMDILYTVKSVTGALRRWVEANPELTGTLMKASAVVAAVIVGLGTLAVALAAVLGPLAVIRLGFSVLGKDLSDKPVEHIDQTNESDGSFLMRLARQYGAIASVKNGNLLFIRQGQGKSATDKPLPVITITRKDGDSHRFTLADRGAYTGVIASWLHTREPAKKESTTVKRKRRTKKQKKEPEAKQGDYLVGTDENVLVLNRTYANRSNAERAAKMQWERLQRGVASFSLQLAEGRADLYTEMPVKVSGFKQPIDDAEWTITTLTHTVSPDNGFTTSLELEVRIDDFEME